MYFSSWPLTGRHANRPPLLQPDPDVHAPDVVGEYQRALASGDVDAILATFEPDGYMREPAGGVYVHRGTDELRALYELFFSNGGGIPLEHCTVTDDGRACALEYNVVRLGPHRAAPGGGHRRLRARRQRQARRRARLRRLRPAAGLARLRHSRETPATRPRRSTPCAPTSFPAGPFPTTSCPITRDVPRKLSELQGDDPMILTLARGHYCPKEHQQHLELAANYPKIAVAYTRIATIATDPHHTLQEFRSVGRRPVAVPRRPGRIVQKDLDIQEYTDPDNDPMIPHTLVLKPGLVVHRIYNGYWFWGRPSFVDLWRDLRDVTREVRPDWDLSTPGLREAWEAGDVSPFHGWDRRPGPSRGRLAESP